MSPASRLYEGRILHRRYRPVEHGFRYRLFMLYLALEELPELFDRIPLWSARRPAPAVGRYHLRRRNLRPRGPQGRAQLTLSLRIRAEVQALSREAGLRH